MKSNIYNVFRISKEEDLLFHEKGYCHTYGFLTKSGIQHLISTIYPPFNTGIFYDLGCGNGELIINLVQYCKTFSHYIGIEYSKERIDDFQRLLKQKKHINSKKSIKAIHGDLFDYNYSDASVIYISNLCFPEHVNRNIGKMLDSQIVSSCIIFSSKDIYLNIEHKKKIVHVNQSWSSGEKTELIQYII